MFLKKKKVCDYATQKSISAPIINSTYMTLQSYIMLLTKLMDGTDISVHRYINYTA
jgi:hypothetical protein